jgi:hypothetical protein
MGCQDFSHRRFQLSHVRLLHLETNRAREGENPAKIYLQTHRRFRKCTNEGGGKKKKKEKEWENFKGCQASTN